MANGEKCPKMFGSEFDLVLGNWSTYVERLRMHFVVNEVKESLRLPMLISAMGDAAYELMVTLCSPEKPDELGFDKVVKIVQEHLQPIPSIVAERYKFRQCRQLAGQSISVYVAELKRLARTCQFTESLDDNLRDQLVCGLNKDYIRQRLFTEQELKFNNALAIAKALEAAEQNAAVVEGNAAGVRNIGVIDGVHTLSMTRCTACGSGGHQEPTCKFLYFTCHCCGKMGHLERVCPDKYNRASMGAAAVVPLRRGSRRGRQRERNRNASGRGGNSRANANWVLDDSDGTGNEDEELVYQMSLRNYAPVSLPLSVEGQILMMEIDTGSALSCISKQTYEMYIGTLPLEQCRLSLRFYDGSKIKPLGYVKANVHYNKVNKILDLYVIDKGTTNLLGRQWLAELNIKIPQFSVNNVKSYNVNRNDLVNFLINRYANLFDEKLGRFTGACAELRVRAGAEPVFCRARPLPYALRTRVDDELDAMLAEGVIEPVDCSDWATPLVVVRKADGGLRICADYKVTLNPVLSIDKYPVPKIEDLFANLSGSVYFTKLDLSQAYNQVVLSENSRKYTVINTHRGLFKYNRLVFGLASSPGIFQRLMTDVLKDIPDVMVFLDDILIVGKTIESNLATTERVLCRLHDCGLKIKRQKCVFLVEEVSYLGFIINKNGVRVDQDKIKPIVDMPCPCNVSELRSFLGMINFYSKFIANLSSLLSPLYMLLKKHQRWRWGEEQDRVFNEVKSCLIKAPILGHYDFNGSLPLVLTCDASGRGVGAVLAQRVHGREQTVAYASRALTEAERNYSQIHREALAIVFAVKKFHQFLYGRHFLLRTDHKPLISIFGPGNGVPVMTASRLQRWAVFLSAYNFEIEFVKTDKNVADALSRLIRAHKSGDGDELDSPEQTYLHFASEALLLDYKIVKAETAKDRTLSRVLSYIRDGWPVEAETRELSPYFNRKTELYCELGCIMWGHRVVVPMACRDRVLKEVHDSHMGIVKTKQMARSYAWWPGIDEAIEAECRACRVCAAVADAPPAHEPRCWSWPDRPWSRLHLDFLGPVAGVMYLVVVDSHSKWIEIERMNSTTASGVIQNLRNLWARFGLPKQVVSDNGPPFSSSEFKNFLLDNGVGHTFSAPYHPASNGAAENAVKTCKRVIKKAVCQRLDIQVALCRFLLTYRNTEHCTTGMSPAMLLQGRSLRTRLDCMKPDRDARVYDSQLRQVRASGGVTREFAVGDLVWCRHFRMSEKWKEGTVIERLGDTDYLIRNNDGTEAHRHVDQIRPRVAVPGDAVRGNRGAGRAGGEALMIAPSSPASPGVEGMWPRSSGSATVTVPDPSVSASAPVVVDGTVGERRYPVRERRPPTRFFDEFA